MKELEIIKIVRSQSCGEWCPGPQMSKDFREGWVEGWAMAIESVLDDLMKYFLDNMSHEEIRRRTDSSTIRRMKVVDKFTDRHDDEVEKPKD